MAHPFNSRFPISVEAVSDCCRRRRDSSVSGGMSKAGGPIGSDTSVWGVEDLEWIEPEEMLSGDWDSASAAGIKA
jgi:hypothetical protein